MLLLCRQTEKEFRLPWPSFVRVEIYYRYRLSINRKYRLLDSWILHSEVVRASASWLRGHEFESRTIHFPYQGLFFYFLADMLTLPLSAEVYRFLSASSAYRFTIQIFRFLSNLPLSNHWVLFTPSEWDWVTVCHHYINVMTAIQEIVKTCVMQSNCITRSTWQVKRLF